METINLEKLYSEIKKIRMAMITRNELNTFFETIGILSNPETMNQIRNSERDIELGNLQEINSINDF